MTRIGPSGGRRGRTSTSEGEKASRKERDEYWVKEREITRKPYQGILSKT